MPIIDFDIEPDFLCPITQQVMEDPVSASDGHTYERKAIETWFQHHLTSPLTNQRLNSKDLHPNHFAKKMIRNALEKSGICSKEDYLQSLNSSSWSKFQTLRFPVQYLNLTKDDGQTLFHQAVQEGQMWMVEQILKTDFDIGNKNSEGNTALHLAAQKGMVEMAVKLVSSGMKVNMRDNDGWTPLHRAAQKGHVDVVKELIKCQGDVNAAKKNGNTPLHSAAWNGHAETVRELIKAGANLNAKSNIGDTSLHSATWQNRVAVVQELIQANVDINARKKNGDTALHLAARRDNFDVAKELISANANINAVNDEGYTPLFVAVESSKSKQLISLLLRSGADPSHQNKQGKTALDMCSNDDMAKWMEEEQDKYAQMLRRLPLKVNQLENTVKQQQEAILKLQSLVKQQQETIQELKDLVQQIQN